LTIRPENISLIADDQTGNQNELPGKIISAEYLGRDYRYQIKTDLGVFRVDEASKFQRGFGEKVLLSFPDKYLLPLKN
jgi:putative spermidine/putrescine transport system ATP-binding protein